MKKVKVKIPAKINLTLDIKGVKDGYHELSSLVASVNIYDEVRAKARKDGKINLTFVGIPAGIVPEKSNAYLAAVKLKEEYGFGGADIRVKRGIPVGAGLGGSSADVAGVLIALNELYGTGRDVTGIANSVGSDVAYMLKGGFAVMKGRGERVERLSGVKRAFYVLIATGTEGVSTAESYAGYDLLGKTYAESTAAAVTLLKADDADGFLALLKNDLYESSVSILPEIKETVGRLKEYGAAVMTGSGSAVYGIYKSKKEFKKAYKALYAAYGKRLIKAKTL